MTDTYKLERFVLAQSSIFHQVKRELANGSKRGHWMWFIFPQIHGLGQSSTSRFYAISSINEASAYLNHSILGPRLIECTELVMKVNNRSARRIFGGVDQLKFHSSMTLFSLVPSANRVFSDALNKYFDGERDCSTLELI